MFKTLTALLLGKAIFFFSRILKIGGGYAAPGLYALKIDPGLVANLVNHQAKNIVVTGTNGKTTTAKLISHFLKTSKVKVIRNSSGSNLERGIASYLVSHASLFGNLDYDFGVWELDEFAFNSVTPKIKPDVIILLNAFRDQLDRYGEVDKIIKLWQETLIKLDKETVLIINQDDGNLLRVVKDLKNKVITFSVKDSKISGERVTRTSKKPDYGAEVTDISRLHPKGVNSNLEQIQFNVSFSGGSLEFTLPLPGVFNVYNFLAAFALSHLLNLDIQKIDQSLVDFKPAFGRFEKFEIEGKEGNIFLIKNPIGATQVLQTVLPHISAQDSLLIALNDNFADGTDVSWIWDAEFERVKGEGERGKIFVSGTRAYDMALRLKYAGINQDEMVVNKNIDVQFEKAVKETEGKIFILPTYTALMELQKILVKKGIKKEYWKE